MQESDVGAGGDDESRDIEPRTGTPEVRLGEEEFRRRFLSQFIDPAFEQLSTELDRIAYL